jgi:cytoskeletal protein CcmA (bactofilin family)
MSETTKQTIIENGTEFDGSIKSECAITLSGKVTGQVSAPALTVMPSGSVRGKVKVSRLKAQGEVAGEIEAETVELSGRVDDQTVIRAKTLEVMLTQPQGGLQVTFGNCELQIGDKKTRADEKTKGSTESAKKEQAKDQSAEPMVPVAVGTTPR